MNIAFIHNMEISVDSRTQKEIDTLLKAGHKVYFCGWNKDKNGSIERQEILLRGRMFQYENICIKVKKRAGLKENIKPLLRYFRVLRKWLQDHAGDIDAIHACNMDTAMAALLFAKKNHKRIVYDIYDDYADSHVAGKFIYRVLKAIDACVIRLSDTVIICSEKRKEQLATTKTKRIVVIHNTPDIQDVNPELMRLDPSDKLRLAYIGNLDETRYIEELTEIIGKHKDWELHIAGGGAIEKQIERLADMNENIFFYGRLSYEQTLSLEMNCDVLPALYIPTLKNHKYAAPNKFYEALMLGKPIIMFRNTGVDDLVQKYKTGVVADYNKESVEKSIEQIEQERVFWLEQKEEIQEIYKKNFSWEIMARRLVQLYKKLEK